MKTSAIRSFLSSLANRIPGRKQDYWDIAASEAIAQQALLYERFAHGVRGDRKLRSLAALGRAGQPKANLLYGAVHYLLLRGAEHPLKAYYPTLTAKSASKPAGDPFPLFQDFCRAHRTEIAQLIATRVINTNEVGRAAYLRAGFAVLAAEAAAPLHLIELGPSAGLNMQWDRFRYVYRMAGRPYFAGPEDAPIAIEITLGGANIPPLGLNPPVTTRIGIELDPVDLSKPEERDWLRALVWPDHAERFRRLEKVLAMAVGELTDIRHGDALALLPQALADCPPEGTICIYHTVVTYQFPDRLKAALEQYLLDVSRKRPFYRLSMEWDGKDFPLILARYSGGAKTERVLALCNHQGSKMEWLGEKPAAPSH